MRLKKNTLRETALTAVQTQRPFDKMYTYHVSELNFLSLPISMHLGVEIKMHLSNGLWITR